MASITIKGTIRYSPTRPNQNPSFIHIYPSAHIPASRYCYARTDGFGGDFQLQIPLTSTHYHGQKGSNNTVIIPRSSLLCFDVMEGKFEVVDKDGADELKKEMSECHNSIEAFEMYLRGYYTLGCTQIDVRKAWVLKSALQKRNQSSFPSVDLVVADCYDMNRGAIVAGLLSITNLWFEIHNASFESPVWGGASQQHFSQERNVDMAVEDIITAPDTTKVRAFLCPVFNTRDNEAVSTAVRSVGMFTSQPYGNPIIHNIRLVHCPYYQQARCFNIGGAYPMHRPYEYSDEGFYAKLIRTALYRSSVPKQWFMKVVEAQMALPKTSSTIVPGFPLAYALAGQALCVLAASCYYTGDRTENSEGEEEASDRYNVLRLSETDDCEGLSHEICLEVMELVEARAKGYWQSRLVKAFADTVKYTVPLMTHGAVMDKTIGSKSNVQKSVAGKYSRTVSGGGYPASYTTSEEDPAPCIIPEAARRDPFYARGAPERRQALVEYFDTKSQEYTEHLECHSFMLLEPSLTFLSALKRTEAGSSCIDSGIVGTDVQLLDPSLLPAWSAKLPRLLLEGTDHVFPLQFPLGLLYPPGSEERKKMESYHCAINDTRSRLESKHTELSILGFTTLAPLHACSKQTADVLRWEKSAHDFYWFAVGAYVPTVCERSPSFQLRGKEERRGDAFREIAFVNPETHTYGMLVTDVLYGEEGSNVGYVPTLVLTPDESKRIEERLLLEVPVPPVVRKGKMPEHSKVNAEAHEYEPIFEADMRKLAQQLRDDAVRLLPASRPRKRETDNGQEASPSSGIPPGSFFDHSPSKPINITYHVRAERVKSGLALRVLKQALSDPQSKIMDVKVKVHNLGRPVPVMHPLCMFDITLEIAPLQT